MRRLFATLLLLATAPASALAPEEFAYALPLVPERPAPLYRLLLPTDVYLQSTRADLGDLRVFDSRGEVVPHAVLAPVADTRSSRQPVPLFPLPRVERDQPLALDVQTDGSGAVIAVTQAGAAADVGGRWLLDLTGLNRPVSALHLEWPAATAPFSASAQVFASDDLEHWRPLARGTLADLRFDGQRLLQATLALPATAARYLRIDLTQPAVELRAAAAELRETDEPEWQWRTLAVLRPDPEGGVIYDSGGRLPVRRVNLAFAEPGRLLAAHLEAADDPTGPWRAVHGGLFYRLAAVDGTLANPPAAVALTKARYWRLRSRDGGGIPTPPQLVLGWQPQRLVFLDRGAEPYRLVYGNAGLEPAAADVANLLGTLEPEQTRFGEVGIGAREELAGAAALSAAPTLPWRTWLLWAALIGAALALATMALRLLREMRDASP